ncbi:MAG: histidine phosphatase family protein [Deltaproteobacteria bacterium]|nr:histidine phosphatase family protein [Deltaproteobacteria bacterium]
MSEQKKPTRLLLVRHGEVVSRGQGKFLGFTDLGLSLRGKRQVQSLAEYLKEAPLDQAYASDLKRAVDSARSICQGRSIRPVTRPAFREMNMGDWDGKSWDEVKKKNPEFKALFFYDLKNFYFPGGENWSQFRSRVLKGLKTLLQEEQGKDILLVAHAGVNRIILAQALGLRFKNMFFMDQGYACLNIIEFYGKASKVVLMNGIYYK